MDSTHDLLGQIAAVIEERDSLRNANARLVGRNQELDALARRQGVVIAKFADAMTELQAFLDETQLIVAPIAAQSPGLAPEPPAPDPDLQPALAKGHSARRYTDDDAREWASALRQGKTQLEVSETYGVTTTTIKARLERLGYDPKTGQILEDDDEAESDDHALDPDIVVYDDEEEGASEPPFLRSSNGNGHGGPNGADAATSS